MVSSIEGFRSGRKKEVGRKKEEVVVCSSEQ